MSPHIRGWFVLGAVAGAFLVPSCSRSSRTVSAAVKPEKDRKVAPDFSLKDASGQAVKLSDYRGKVVLLDFWATWCGPCKIEIPWFMEFQQTLKDRGFEVLGVSMDEDGWDAVKPFIEARKVNYRVLLGNDHVGELYGGLDSLPTTFLIDRSGRIAGVHIGLEISKDGFRNEITHLLDSPRVGGVRAPVLGVPAVFGRAN